MEKFILASLVVILGFNFLGIFSGWYVSVWWYDIPMHLAGGAWVAFLFYYIFTERWEVFRDGVNGLFLFTILLGFVALVGVFWEFFEYSFDVFVAGRHPFIYAQQGLADTMGDLVNDLLGGAAVALARRFLKFRGVSGAI